MMYEIASHRAIILQNIYYSTFQGDFTLLSKFIYDFSFNLFFLDAFTPSIQIEFS